MLHIVGRTQIRISLSTTCHTIRLELADEQQHLAAALLVVDITLTGGRIIHRRALALPVEQALIDGVVVVHGRGRIVLDKLEAAITNVSIPTEREFWEHWSSFDELSKSIYTATAENRIWELETDPYMKKYYKTCSEHIIAAGLAKEGKPLLDIVAELEATQQPAADSKP